MNALNDHFDIFGIARTFREKDAAQLERRFHELQRRFHPDHAAARGATAVHDALEESSMVNEAYRTLRDPLARAKYLLSLYGYTIERSKQVPPDLLELVMNVQEHVAMVQAGAKQDGALLGVEAELIRRRAAITADIESAKIKWDSEHAHAEPGGELNDTEKQILESLSRSLAVKAYLDTLEATLQAAKQGKSLVLKH